MTEQEKELLKRLAEAYAFLTDLHNTALQVGSGWVVRKMKGFDKQIRKIKEDYPRDFQRYLNKALLSAKDDAMKQATLPDGERKEVPRRQTTAKAEEPKGKEEERRRPEPQRLAPARRQRKKKKKSSKRNQPE